jgi:hypothetical protein
VDLYLDDIEDQKTFPDDLILLQIRSMIRADVREGPLVDYKADVSEKDNWPDTVASFANCFGGVIIFGVEAKNDRPLTLSGFDPRNREIKTMLTNTILSRIQPRPDIAVRVVVFDEDPQKEVAVLRVSEGLVPPYMHSKGEEHRIFLRITARKVEADYLQLSSLIEKRVRSQSRNTPRSTLIDPQSPLQAYERAGSNIISRNFYRFIISPQRLDVGPRLNFGSERSFRSCVDKIWGAQSADLPVRRTRDITVFSIRSHGGGEWRLGLDETGALGFASRACVDTETAPCFAPIVFCHNLLDFLITSSLFHERVLRFFGSSRLNVSLCVDEVLLVPGFPTRSPNGHMPGSELFHPPLESLSVNTSSEVEINLQPMTRCRLLDCLEAILLSLVRPAGHVLHPRFEQGVQELVTDALERLKMARDL